MGSFVAVYSLLLLVGFGPWFVVQYLVSFLVSFLDGKRGFVCCALLYVHSSFAIILMGKRERVALLVSGDCCVALPRDAMGLSAV